MNINFITNIGIGVILLYSIIKLMNIYGIEMSTYGTYLSFYVFLFISYFILPRQYPNFT